MHYLAVGSLGSWVMPLYFHSTPGIHIVTCVSVCCHFFGSFCYFQNERLCHKCSTKVQLRDLFRHIEDVGMSNSSYSSKDILYQTSLSIPLQIHVAGT